MIGGFDPASGMHLDDDGRGPRPAQPRAKPRASRPVDIMLKSSPPNAMAAVDGVQVGPTPAYWQGEADGREHEFTFVLPGYATARYRFVPVTSGVVHARLEPIAQIPDDGGLGPLIAPTFAPDAAVAPQPKVTPPPTVLTPDAARPLPPVAPAPDASTAPATPPATPPAAPSTPVGPPNP